ncbi:MAG: lipopolysaccharide kinase InaA family protein [Planctomycetota bacterium]
MNTHCNKCPLSKFQSIRKKNILYSFRAELRETVSADFPEIVFKTSPIGTVTGRKKHNIVEINGRKFVIRHYEHGGLLRSFTRDVYPSPQRFMNEMFLSSYALSNGIPTPEISALRVTRTLFGYKADLVTFYIENSVDLQTLLQNKLSDIGLPRKKELIYKCACIVRKMHDAGIIHNDLHIKNILLSRNYQELKLFILDLDGAEISKELNESIRLKNLFRLGRSLDKLENTNIITEKDKYTFFLKYLKSGNPLSINRYKAVYQFSKHRKLHSFWRYLLRKR